MIISRLRRLYDAMFDRKTMHGNMLIIVISSLACLLIWHMEGIDIWFDKVVLGRDYHAQLLSEGQLRTRRFFAGALFIAAFSVHFILLLVAAREKLLRRRAKKSVQGQWYDTENLIKEDLYADKDVDDERE